MFNIQNRRIFKLGEAAKYLGVSVSSLQKMDKNGRLKARRTDTNRRFYYQSDLDEFLNGNNRGFAKIVGYVRVATKDDKEAAKKQADVISDYAIQEDIELDKIIVEYGSGLDYKRPKWSNLLDEVDKWRIGTIIVANQERFVWIGFDWFESFCATHGCTIINLRKSEMTPSVEIVNVMDELINGSSTLVSQSLKQEEND